MSHFMRHHATGHWIRVEVQDLLIAEVESADGPEAISDSDAWLAPAFWDLQLNGRWGVSFSDPELTVEHVAAIVRAQAELGTARLCPTLISATFECLRRGVATIAAASDQYADVGRRVLGIHLEGPYLSELPGYRGAHPAEALHDADWAEFERLQEAAGGRIVLITLAPERPGAIEFIRKATANGIIVALGHTAADGRTIREAAQAGARLSTHLGNGIAAQLARHPNPIWNQAADDRLWATLIADGHHLDEATLRVLVRAKTPERIILVSDASPLAGLPPGRYGEWAVDPAGKIVVAGTPYLAGSNQALETGVNFLIRSTALSLSKAVETVTCNAARLLGRPEPKLEPGQSANFVRFRLRDVEGSTAIELVSTCVDGEWTPCSPALEAPWK
ncbi:MAG TPA: amidohydrolase family protein [Isosphaeraceae bacterium]|jgi:N-acetylglucosamine-6-phosphate deacetylase|nr:amidohydrolase family protein [Isosphaeraceae bacterium]